MPAVNVEAEARSRLGETLKANGRTIMSSVAVRVAASHRLLVGKALRAALESDQEIEYALFTGDNPVGATRWPAKGWLRGSLADLSLLAQSAGVPPEVIEKAADRLVAGVGEAAGLLNEVATTHPGVLTTIASALCQEDGEQTRRMATTILANAFVFHESLSHGPGGLATVLTLDEMRAGKTLTRTGVLEQWEKILAVNYWPIFDVAKRILAPIPSDTARLMIDSLSRTASSLVENRLTRSHDLTGAVFQKLIVDRKFLAAYYTTPASAALMTGLVFAPDVTPANKPWSDAPGVTDLKIADFACGTGTLLSAAYTRVGQLHELAGGDAEAIHSQMMATALVGCDVLPAAAHLTASMLSGTHPTKTYEHSSVMTVPYGAQPDGEIALGSLDLIAAQGTIETLSRAATAAGGTGAIVKDIWTEVAHKTFDAVLMNPPFTRPTGQEGKKVGVPNPMFAAFGTDKDAQRSMKVAFDKLLKGLPGTHCYDGQAGQASAFLELADRKLKELGRLGLIMPMSLMTGPAWDKSRKLLRTRYRDLVFLTIAGGRGAEISFSADTGMAECMISGRKEAGGSERATFVVLSQKPASRLDGEAIARAVTALSTGAGLRRLEDGPVGGTLLRVGDDVIGSAVSAPLSSVGVFNIARIADLSLAQTAFDALVNRRGWLPGMNLAEAFPLPLAPVKMLGNVGPYHSDISGKNANGSIRGPFEVLDTTTPATVTYPILWAHDADRERTIEFTADCEGQVWPTKDAKEAEDVMAKVSAVMKTASHLHFNENFQFNSQSTAFQYTPRLTLGGRAWTSVKLATAEAEMALALWGNTSLGMLLHWWHANRQQDGRGNIGKEALGTLDVLDVRTLTPAQLDTVKLVYAEFKDRALRPLNEIHLDTVRAELDSRFLGDVLGVDAKVLASGGSLELLRAKLAAEPSITGSKKG